VTGLSNNDRQFNKSSADGLRLNGPGLTEYEEDVVGLGEGTKELEDVLTRVKELISGENLTLYAKQATLLIADSSPLLKIVAISYTTAVIQLAVVYLLSSKVIMAWFTNKALVQASENVSRILHAHGVSHVLEDVLGTRMVRVRQKLLKCIAFSKEVEGLLPLLIGTINTEEPSGARSLFDHFGFGRKNWKNT